MRRKAFTPAARGNLFIAIAEKILAKVVPESPRPVPLLDGVKISSEDKLTATDTALYELLLSRAYESDTENKSAGIASDGTHKISVSVVLPFLGTSARCDAVKSALRRLNKTTITFGSKATHLYENVPLISAWFESNNADEKICFSFPQSIQDVMRRMPGYAYIELAPLPNMKSRYSIRLYKKTSFGSIEKGMVTER